jgi:hypothetical protein
MESASSRLDYQRFDGKGERPKDSCIAFSYVEYKLLAKQEK